jgi:hypothetical protein
MSHPGYMYRHTDTVAALQRASSHKRELRWKGWTRPRLQVCTISLGSGIRPPIQSRCGCRGDADLAHVDPIVQSCTATDKKVGSLLVASSDSQYQRATRIAQLCNSTL